VAFFVSIVFLDIVQIVTAVTALDRVQLKHALCGSLRGGWLPDDDRAVHFGGNNDAREDTSTN